MKLSWLLVLIACAALSIDGHSSSSPAFHLLPVYSGPEVLIPIEGHDLPAVGYDAGRRLAGDLAEALSTNASCIIRTEAIRRANIYLARAGIDELASNASATRRETMLASLLEVLASRVVRAGGDARSQRAAIVDLAVFEAYRSAFAEWRNASAVGRPAAQCLARMQSVAGGDIEELFCAAWISAFSGGEPIDVRNWLKVIYASDAEGEKAHRCRWAGELTFRIPFDSDGTEAAFADRLVLFEYRRLDHFEPMVRRSVPKSAESKGNASRPTKR